MGYVVTTYAVTAGTMSRRKVNEVRRDRLDRAVGHAKAAGCATRVVTVSATSRAGRTLLGTVQRGEFTPTEAYARHTDTGHTATTDKEHTMTETTETAPFIVLTWETESGSIKRRAEYKTEKGALAGAAKASDKPGIRNAEVYKGDTKVANRIASYRKGQPEGAAPAAPESDEAPVVDEPKRPAGTTARVARKPMDKATAKGLTTWAAVLEHTDGALEQGYRAERPQLKLPLDIAKLDRFDSLYLRFLCGERQTGPSGKRYGTTAEQQKDARAKLRKRIATAVKKDGEPGTVKRGTSNKPAPAKPATPAPAAAQQTAAA